MRAVKILGGAVAATIVAAAPLPIAGFTAAASTLANVPRGQGVKDFYEARRQRPLWFEAGRLTPAGQDLLSLLSSASVDGLNPSDYLDGVGKAIATASPSDEHAILKADELLSQAFADYVRDLRNASDAGMHFVAPGLKPAVPTPLASLATAAAAPSLDAYVKDMGWMNPVYAQLRKALASGSFQDQKQRDLLTINMARARILPAGPGRYVLVNPAEQRLYMYQDGKAVDSMKVVVGQQREDRNTPMFATYVYNADLNPYWSVPPDLVGDDVAIHVLKQGLGYLKTSGFQVLSDWSDNATVVDPTTIDWKAVYAGKVQLRVRQLPGPHNVLGTLMFNVPNPYGVYLHDTSQRELLDKNVRLYSGGCIRLEDAPRLGTWLFGHPLDRSTDQPDVQVPLQAPVPVYVTYLTAVPHGSSVTFLDDVYGRDAQELAQLQGDGGGKAKAAMR
jgi:murein L,D-transpeptidase YcbB/YkuD